MADEDISYMTEILRNALEGRPVTASLKPMDALRHLDAEARTRRFEAAQPVGALRDDLRDPHLLAVLRPGVAELLVKIVTRRNTDTGEPSSAIEFVEWLIKRHNFRCYMCPDGCIQAEAADLTEEVYDLTLRDAAQRGEIDRLHDALLAVDRTYTGTEPAADALAEVRRITQAALQPAPIGRALAPLPNAQATLEAGRRPTADAEWIEMAFQAGSRLAATHPSLSASSAEAPGRSNTTPAYRLWWWRGYYYQRDQIEHVTAAAAARPAAA